MKRARLVTILFGLGLLGWGMALSLLSSYEIHLLALPVASASEAQEDEAASEWGEPPSSEGLAAIHVHVGDAHVGVPCPLAAIVVANVDTDERFSTLADKQGVATVAAISPGEYELFLEFEGNFALYRGIRVGPEETAVVHAHLHTGGAFGRGDQQR